MLLIPRSIPGIRTRKIEIGAGGISATTYVIFEDVKVPAEYLVGQEGMGFKYTMSNFNHERLWIAFQAIRGARICLEDTMQWCQKREAFGKTLIEQPVVRHKLGHMARQIDGLQAWTESIIYELENMSHAQGNDRIVFQLTGNLLIWLRVSNFGRCHWSPESSGRNCASTHLFGMSEADGRVSIIYF